MAFLTGLVCVLALGQNPPVTPPENPTLARESAAPFSWFRVPSDVVGFKDCPEGFQLTYDAAWNFGLGEFELRVGPDLVRPAQRVRLVADDLPEYFWVFDRDNVRYRVSTFGTTPDQNPRNLLVAMIRVEAKNLARVPKRAHVYGAVVPRQENARHELPGTDWYVAKFADLKELTFSNGLARNNDHILAVAKTQDSDWTGNLELRENLVPGESITITYKVPYIPLSKTKMEAVKGFNGLEYGPSRQATAAVWKSVFDRAMEFDLPESKPVRAYRSSLALLLMARDAQEDPTQYVQKVNEIQYDRFYARDTAFIARSYDMVGLHDVAKQVLQSYLVRDDKGQVVGFVRTMPDDWGQSIWALACHIRATGDMALAREIFPALANHLTHFREEVAKDPLNLWPVAGAYDNEVLNGHYTSHNLWALLAMREAAHLARLVGKPETAKVFDDYHAQFRARFLKRLRWIVDQTGGYIPPGVDKPLEGHDWENASGAVYPFRVFPPDHPYVKTTIDLVRETKYREGIMTWGPNAFNLKQQILAGVEDPDPLFLHHYQTFHVMQTMLAQGRQQDVVEDLYSVLVHTSSTNAGFETSVRPWADRDTGGNFPPHGWFAGRYVEMLRNMFVREDGDDLHLLSAISPTWVQPGHPIRIKRAAHDFGSLDLTLSPRSSGGRLELKSTWRRNPAKLIVHWPWFVQPISVKADGKSLAVRDRVTVLPVRTRVVEVQWKRLPVPKLSYEEAVRLWLQKNYNPKPGEDRMYLFPRPTKPRIVGNTRLFVGASDVALTEPTGIGIIRYTLDGSDPTKSSALYRKPIRVAKNTTLKAASFWPDGRQSPTMVAQLIRTEPVPPSVQKVAGPGLQMVVYTGSIKALAEMGTLAKRPPAFVKKVGLDFPGIPEDNYALRFYGAFLAEKTGIYTFALGSDDGSRLRIAGQTVIDNDGLHAYKEVRGQIALQKGWHPFEVSFFDYDSANYLRLFQIDDQNNRTPIPESRFGVVVPEDDQPVVL